MARPPGSVYRKLVTALLILCGAASSVIIGSMLHRDGRLNIPFFAGAAGAVKPPVRVIYVTEFLDCGDELRETESISPDDLPVLLETLSPDWTVAKNTEGEVRLWRGVPGYCGTHHRQRLIALYRGHICVFRGREKNPDFIVQEHHDIREVDLFPADREYLKNGKVIDVDAPAPEGAPGLPDDQVDDWFRERLKRELEGITLD
ncbi:MAG: hypothetical protein ACOX5M_02600 [Bacillota bacterium]